MALQVLILAAGKGTRMRSRRPKVLQPLADQSLLSHVLAAAFSLDPKAVHIIVGYQAQTVVDYYQGHPRAQNLNWITQTEQLGTGHAVKEALPHLTTEDDVLILYGDVPLLKPETLSTLVEKLNQNDLSLLTVEAAKPEGYGRIVRDQSGGLQAIVEHKDASDHQRQITEINSGILAVKGALLHELVPLISNDNAQQEYYLTDLIGLATERSHLATAYKIEDEDEVLGVNDRIQLAHLERVYALQKAQTLLQQGVTLKDPARFDCRGTLEAGQDVVLDVNVIIEGAVTLEDGVTIGAHCILKDCYIKSDAVILPYSSIEGSTIGAAATIGPYARIRPGCELFENTKVGNFVELKNTQLSAGAKANHLTYLGDAKIGERANIGAGTITCNYDGANKHKTVIAADAFVGSNTALVAPVAIGENTTIGAGSTITKDVPAQTLAVARARQESIPGWQKPVKKT